MARKPLSESTVVANVLKHGTGAINIDACRVGAHEMSESEWINKGMHRSTGNIYGEHKPSATPLPKGRFPANLILDEEAARLLDEQSGQLTSGFKIGGQYKSGDKNATWRLGHDSEVCHNDTGGASRFFYTAKASGTDRGNKVKGALPLFGVDEETFRNTHPTVKPVALMLYLLKMVFPPRAHVLDPFLGSGTTAVACQQLGIDCTGIELEAESVAIAKERLAA
jgi:site-specific DNA-methyltransferase (adenine-specific)